MERAGLELFWIGALCLIVAVTFLGGYGYVRWQYYALKAVCSEPVPLDKQLQALLDEASKCQ